MKDYWREESKRTRPEADIYRLLEEKKVEHVAKMETGGDVVGLVTRTQEPRFLQHSQALPDGHAGKQTVTHSVIDDKESAFWVLLYVALRYLKNNLSETQLYDTLSACFDASSFDTLIETFPICCAEDTSARHQRVYDSLLKVFGPDSDEVQTNTYFQYLTAKSNMEDTTT
ncbi:hypothetical protein CPB85DRAFT_1334379, partial [Mucidula mucida]